MRRGDFHHVLITRFNVPIAWSARGKAAPRNLEPSWLDARLRLFERYTLPSVIAQTNQAFDWLLLCDARTPPELRERIEGYGRAQPLWIDYAEPSRRRERLLSALAERCGEVPWAVTTRLDNDDAIRRTFVASIQRRVRGRREFIDFPRGYHLSLLPEGGSRVLRYRWRVPSPFASLVEPTHRMTSVYCGLPHARLGELAPVRNVRLGRHWLVVAHGGNLSHRRRSPRGRRELRESSLTRAFGLDLGRELPPIPERRRSRQRRSARPVAR